MCVNHQFLIISFFYACMQHKNADQNRVSIKNGEETVVYVKPEDEIFFEVFLWSLVGATLL